MKIRTLLYVLISTFFVSSAFAQPNLITISPRQITSVYDGDTFRAYLPGITPQDKQSTRIRIRHIDTPEIKGQCVYEKDLAAKARGYGMELLTGSRSITLSQLGRDRYGRLLATVTLNGNISYANKMLSAGLARPYEGGRRNSWCHAK
ncbi:thermonuclease family protein [Photobacterium damselae]|uniref:Staphylococcal nuclease homologue n=2 Tax=Photobacterium damselae TaxID=38293 RepID=A0A2X1XWM1_PHODM|nr:thermonuclease family protein [Photobacterium damselae]SPY45164.1 Staphylococcal nuclease homologue [Photobacterium damselae]